jgi:hypothetical protein
MSLLTTDGFAMAQGQAQLAGHCCANQQNDLFTQ